MWEGLYLRTISPGLFEAYFLVRGISLNGRRAEGEREGGREGWRKGTCHFQLH